MMNSLEPVFGSHRTHCTLPFRTTRARNTAPPPQVLQQQRERRGGAADLAALQAFRFKGLAGELQVGGVFVRVFNERARAGTAGAAGNAAAAAAASAASAAGGGEGGAAAAAAAAAPADPAGFCKALVRFLYERLVEKAARGASLTALPAVERSAALEALAALGALLRQEPRLLGLLTSKSALSPLVAALAPAAGEQQQQEASGVGGTDGSSGDSAAAVAADAEALAAESLALLASATQSAQLVQALVDEPFVRTLLRLAHAPPSARVLAGALGLLRALSALPAVALVAGYQGGAVMLLDVLLHAPGAPWPWHAASGGGALPEAEEDAARGAAAAVLQRALADATHGPRLRIVLEHLLPPGLVASIAEGPPEAVLRALSRDVETPECLWDRRMASEAAAEAAALAAAVRARHDAGAFDWSPPASAHAGGAGGRARGELFVGGVYVRLFLKSPRFALRDPVKFAEALAERYLQSLSTAARGAAGGDDGAAAAAAAGDALLLSAALVALLQGHVLLCDHVAQLGYAGRLLAFLASRVPAAAAGADGGATAAAPDELGGSALRVLHQLAASAGAAEALATSAAAPCVPTVAAAMAWGPAAAVLALETLKRALALDNRQRDALVAQALAAQLHVRLLALLDWRAGGGGGGAAAGAGAGAAGGGGDGQDADAAVRRALAVDVLRLLADDRGGAAAARVAEALAGSEVWAAYGGQRHDMFLPSGAAAGGGVAGLLTAAGGSGARFALPAPEALGAAPVAAAAPAVVVAAAPVVVAPAPSAVVVAPATPPPPAAAPAPSPPLPPAQPQQQQQPVAAPPAVAPAAAAAAAAAPASPAATSAAPPAPPVAAAAAAAPPAPPAPPPAPPQPPLLPPEEPAVAADPLAGLAVTTAEAVRAPVDEGAGPL